MGSAAVERCGERGSGTGGGGIVISGLALMGRLLED